MAQIRQSGIKSADNVKSAASIKAAANVKHAATVKHDVSASAAKHASPPEQGPTRHATTSPAADVRAAAHPPVGKSAQPDVKVEAAKAAADVADAHKVALEGAQASAPATPAATRPEHRLDVLESLLAGLPKPAGYVEVPKTQVFEQLQVSMAVLATVVPPVDVIGTLKNFTEIVGGAAGASLVAQGVANYAAALAETSAARAAAAEAAVAQTSLEASHAQSVADQVLAAAGITVPFACADTSTVSVSVAAVVTAHASTVDGELWLWLLHCVAVAARL